MRLGLGTGSKLTMFRRGLGTVQVLPSNIISSIASTITQVEGYFAPGTVSGGISYPNGSLAYQNNNPGNLKYAGQPGASLGVGGFASFDTLADGQQALQNQIQLYAAQGMSIQDMMNIYAPASDGNDPNSYAATIAANLGVTADTSLLSLGLNTGVPSTVGADLSSMLPSFSLYNDDGSLNYEMLGMGLLGIWFVSRM